VKRKAVWFLGPRQLEVREELLRAPGPQDVLVRAEYSGISAGTEMLVYRGELPELIEADLDPVARGLQYPTPFGYCSVGRVVAVGEGIDPASTNSRVFAFQPHASSFVAPLGEMVSVPEDIPPVDAVFLANSETAVNLLHDAAPLLGERVLVLGQGVVGLLTAALLQNLSLACVVTADLHPARRRASAELGVSAVLDPAEPEFVSKAWSLTQGDGFDAVLELSGNPSALNLAVETAAFGGRIIVGSWYGRKRAPLDLGGRFHRSRIRVLSSQVSTIAPELSGRWNKRRRFQVAWETIRRIRPSRWITHRFPVERAEDAFKLLDASQQDTLQVVFEYGAAP
jgi:2-desacetyl-2-hydroxyethyl bacteriochlorophyllide A dehydrogenase